MVGCHTTAITVPMPSSALSAVPLLAEPTRSCTIAGRISVPRLCQRYPIATQYRARTMKSR